MVKPIYSKSLPVNPGPGTPVPPVKPVYSGSLAGRPVPAPGPAPVPTPGPEGSAPEKPVVHTYHAPNYGKTPAVGPAGGTAAFSRKHCPHCGNEEEYDRVYCEKCGTLLRDRPARNQPVSAGKPVPTTPISPGKPVPAPAVPAPPVTALKPAEEKNPGEPLVRLRMMSRYDGEPTVGIAKATGTLTLWPEELVFEKVMGNALGNAFGLIGMGVAAHAEKKKESKERYPLEQIELAREGKYAGFMPALVLKLKDGRTISFSGGTLGAETIRTIVRHIEENRD